VPKWACTEHVEAWVRHLAYKDRIDVKEVIVHAGFTETSRRLFFPYEDQYKDVEPPHLLTVLPSGKIENDKFLKPEKEKALFAYPWCQKMHPTAAKGFLDTNFVWEHGSEYRVCQAWKVDYNADFKDSRTGFKWSDDNPDTDHFSEEVMKEFKQVLRKLFKVPEGKDIAVYYAHKELTNNKHTYEGKGESLMSLLRIHKGVRDDLNIKVLIEPDGFISEWEQWEDEKTKLKKVKKTKHFFMDVTKTYVLYTRIMGPERAMACVKPKDQFDRECKYTGVKQGVQELCQEGQSPEEDQISHVLELDWFAGHAYPYVLKCAWVVWGAAIATVCIRFIGKLAGHTFDHPALLIVMASVAMGCAMYLDFRAMRWCIVPWLQRVQPTIMTRPVQFHTFLIFRLSSTCLQVLTIQMSAWFMVTAVEDSSKNMDFWVYLWDNSGFGHMDENNWRIMTPAHLATIFLFLSFGQLLQPLIAGVPLCTFSSRGDKGLFPARSRSSLKLEEQNDKEAQEAILKEKCPKQVKQGFFLDFDTLWSTLWRCLGAKKCTYRESVAMLAQASGLRYVGSPTISYPRKLIEDIIGFQRGYKIRIDDGYEAMTQGWEMRALKEFVKLGRTHVLRLFFIMFLKLALQMNLQISLFIMDRMRTEQEIFFQKVWNRRIDLSEVAGLVSIASLAFTFCTELLDVGLILDTFYKVCQAVHKRVHACKDSCKDGKQHYAFDDFITMDKSHERIEYTAKHLKEEYRFAWSIVCWIVLIVLVSTWLIGYALTKFFMACYCEYGAWSFASGCLPRCEECFKPQIE